VTVAVGDETTKGDAMRSEAIQSGNRREEFYQTPWGAGRLVTIGDLPYELELPSVAWAAGSVAGSAAGGQAAKSASNDADGQARKGVANDADGQAASSADSSIWRRQLERYFAGEPVTFLLDMAAFASAHGCTEFTTTVYAALATVPYGVVVSYRDLAVLAGRPNAYRAVGSAMARNPLPVILPCHRVIKNDGVCGPYGDDPAWKPRLLELEGRHVSAAGRVLP
jgi:O-6-methylguanine DNA methyltransferase